jgi:hypothetical protein
MIFSLSVGQGCLAPEHKPAAEWQNHHHDTKLFLQ